MGKISNAKCGKVKGFEYFLTLQYIKTPFCAFLGNKKGSAESQD